MEKKKKEMSRTGKSIQAENRLLVPYGWRGGGAVGVDEEEL